MVKSGNRSVVLEGKAISIPINLSNRDRFHEAALDLLFRPFRSEGCCHEFCRKRNLLTALDGFWRRYCAGTGLATEEVIAAAPEWRDDSRAGPTVSTPKSADRNPF